MSAIQRLVTNGATYLARRLAQEFAGKINPHGGDLHWRRGESDWYFNAAPVDYDLLRDPQEFELCLAKMSEPIITDLRAAIEQNPDQKLTFYGITDETLSKFPAMFTDRDFRAKCFAGDVSTLACAAYILKRRRLVIGVHVTPCYVRDSNILVLPIPEAEPCQI